MPKTLLLADDSVTIQKVVGISLASEDITLVAVDNGAAAVAKAKELRPDLILADVVMPQLSGYEVCRQVKADPNLRHIPVLLLTGTFEAFDENKAREVGADGHITKPFEAQSLVELVNARLAAAMPPPVASAPAAAPAASVAAPDPIFGDDEPFDFMSEEITEPSPGRGAGGASDALSFGNPNELELSASDELESDPFGGDAMTRVELAAEDSGVAIPEDDDENAETLPPVHADPLDDEDSPAATQVLFGEQPAAETNAATSVMFSEPEPAMAGLEAKEDLFADMIGGSASSADVTPTDLGDPFADDPEVAAHAAPTPRATIVLGAGNSPAWPVEDEALEAAAEESPAPLRAAPIAPAVSTSAYAPPSRDEMRAMIEKIAWEAFGDVTDRIVRETVQRIEQIAWEVIPKMAEAVIAEEIRKLKEE